MLPGVFSTTAPSAPGEALSFELCDTVADPRAYSRQHDGLHLEEVGVSCTVPSREFSRCNSQCFSEYPNPSALFYFVLPSFQQWVKRGRFDQDRLGPERWDRQELPLGPGDHTRDRSHHHTRTMSSESAAEGMSDFIRKGTRLDSLLYFEKAFSSQFFGYWSRNVAFP